MQKRPRTPKSLFLTSPCVRSVSKDRANTLRLHNLTSALSISGLNGKRMNFVKIWLGFRTFDEISFLQIRKFFYTTGETTLTSLLTTAMRPCMCRCAVERPHPAGSAPTKQSLKTRTSRYLGKRFCKMQSENSTVVPQLSCCPG